MNHTDVKICKLTNLILLTYSAVKVW